MPVTSDIPGNPRIRSHPFLSCISMNQSRHKIFLEISLLESSWGTGYDFVVMHSLLPHVMSVLVCSR